jgi:hypothetical protein
MKKKGWKNNQLLTTINRIGKQTGSTAPSRIE